jgi:hypothetical protein
VAGKEEKGFWSARPTSAPLQTFFAIGTIRLPLAMPHGLAEGRIIILTKAQSETEPLDRTGTPLEGALTEANLHCSGTVNNPVASPAEWACVYVGLEELVEAEVLGVVNLEGSGGLSKTGGSIEFLGGVRTHVEMQGTWAVDAA